jgi:hypothetical protein
MSTLRAMFSMTRKNACAGVKICFFKEITKYDIFHDCDCTYISPLVTVTHSVIVSESKYDGIVVTSKRSLEALSNYYL